MHRKMTELARDAGGNIDQNRLLPASPGCAAAIAASRHRELLLELSRQYGVPLDGVPVVGDSARDIEAARAVNARPLLVLTGNGEATAAKLADEEAVSVETFDEPGGCGDTLDRRGARQGLVACWLAAITGLSVLFLLCTVCSVAALTVLILAPFPYAARATVARNVWGRSMLVVGKRGLRPRIIRSRARKTSRTSPAS